MIKSDPLSGLTPQQAALAAGAASGLLAVVLKAPLWAAVLSFAGGALVTKRLIDTAA